MRKSWIALVLAAAFPGGALAQSAGTGWVRFVDPTENAFAVDAPQGWTTKGGVKRLSSLYAKQWFTAVSPDGTTKLFVGDPEIPDFSVPKNTQAEGAQLPPVNPQLPPGIVLTYRPGLEFAAFWGPKELAAAGCGGAAVTGTQAMPAIAQAQFSRTAEQMRGVQVQGFTPPQHDAGIAGFTCQSGGKPQVAGIIADTTRPMPLGNWSAPLVAGFLTTPGHEQEVMAVMNHILASRQWNPQWDQAMREQLQQTLGNMQQQAQNFSALLQQQSQNFSAMLRANGEAQQQALTANHTAFMNQMNAQSARNNAQFQNYQAQRDFNSWRFDAHIRNGELYQNTTTGRIFEIDH